MSEWTQFCNGLCKISRSLGVDRQVCEQGRVVAGRRNSQRRMLTEASQFR